MSWRNEKWAKDTPFELAQSLDNFAHDDKKEPTMKMAVEEAQYIINLHFESGTMSWEEYSGEQGYEAQKLAKERIRDCKKFIKKYKDK